MAKKEIYNTKEYRNIIFYLLDVIKNFKAAFLFFAHALKPGGALGYFLGGYVPPGTLNWHPVLKKISPKIDTPLEMSQFFIPRSRIRPKTDTPF